MRAVSGLGMLTGAAFILLRMGLPATDANASPLYLAAGATADCPASQAPPPTPVCPPQPGQYACFYRQPNFRGEVRCEPVGTRRPQLRAGDSAVRSVSLTSGVRVELCSAPDFGGACSVLRESAGRLDAGIDGEVWSYAVDVR
jgi:hypothetical protein